MFVRVLNTSLNCFYVRNPVLTHSKAFLELGGTSTVELFFEKVTAECKRAPS